MKKKRELKIHWARERKKAETWHTFGGRDYIDPAPCLTLFFICIIYILWQITAMAVVAGVLPTPSYQGSTLVFGLHYGRELSPTLAPALSQGPSVILFSCVHILIFLWESLNTRFQERMTAREFQVGDQVKMYSFHRIFFIVYCQVLLTSGVSLLN